MNRALVDYKKDFTLADKSTGRASINTFFILPQCQGSGAGRAAMDAVEAEAAKPEYGLKVLTLDTFHPKHLVDQTWKDLGGPDWEKMKPKMSNSQCRFFSCPIPSHPDHLRLQGYERRGYKP